MKIFNQRLVRVLKTFSLSLSFNNENCYFFSLQFNLIESSEDVEMVVFYFFLLLLFFFMTMLTNKKKIQRFSFVFIVRAYHVNDELPNEQQRLLMLSRHKHHRRLSSGMNDISKCRHKIVSCCLCHRMNRCISSVVSLPFFSPFYVMKHHN